MTITLTSAGNATFDMLGAIFPALNSSLEEAVNTNNEALIHETFEVLNKYPEPSFKRYMKDGSYYPALCFSMRTGQFQKVFDAVTIMETHYYQFQTPEIRLCKAACMVQLGKLEECMQYLETPRDPELISLISMKIVSTLAQEKTAYQTLLDFCETAPPQSP